MEWASRGSSTGWAVWATIAPIGGTPRSQLPWQQGCGFRGGRCDILDFQTRYPLARSPLSSSTLEGSSYRRLCACLRPRSVHDARLTEVSFATADGVVDGGGVGAHTVVPVAVAVPPAAAVAG